MKRIFILIAILSLTLAGEKKQLPGQAGNDDIELVGSVISRPTGDPAGARWGSLGPVLRGGADEYVSPKTEKPIAHQRRGRFTMLSRKDGMSLLGAIAWTDRREGCC